ncbi:MAG: hypothetical protein ACK4G5_04010, partial [Devosia sp.]
AALPRQRLSHYSVANGPDLLFKDRKGRWAPAMDSRTGLGRNGGRALILSVLAAICLIMDVNTAYAQAAQCAQLDNALRQFDSNAEFRQMGGNSQAARQAARDVQAMESRYVRDGCNDDAKAGRTLTNQCQ